MSWVPLKNRKNKIFFAPAPFLQECQNFQEWHFSFTLSQPYTVLWFFLLSDPAEFSVALLQHLMHYYRDALTRQHFMCHGHYYGRVWNWFIEKLVDLNHACWCLSVLWTAIPESN